MNYYLKLNKSGKLQMLEFIKDRTATQLSSNNKDAALPTISLYQALAPKDDDNLSTMLYIKGTIFAEKLDSTKLTTTIEELKTCTSYQAEEYIKKLTTRLEQVINYTPPLVAIDGGVWVAEEIPWIYDETKNIMRDTFIWTYYHPAEDSTSFNLKYTNLNCIDVRPTSADSIYVLWCSEKINRNHPEIASILRGVTSTASAHINAEFAQHNKHNFGEELAVGALSLFGEILINSLLDAIFTPSKKMYTFEAHLKYENEYLMTGTIKCQYWKINAEGKSSDYKTETQRITLHRWLKESNIVFENSMTEVLVHHRNSVELKNGTKEYKMSKTTPHALFKKNAKYKSPSSWNGEMVKWLALYNDSLMSSKGFKNPILHDVVPSIGIKVDKIPEIIYKKQKTKNGVYVTEIDIISASNIAGVHKKDIILDVNGAIVKSPNELSDIIKSSKVGECLLLNVLRGKKELIIPVKVTWDLLPFKNTNNDVILTGNKDIDNINTKMKYASSELAQNISNEDSYRNYLLELYNLLLTEQFEDESVRKSYYELYFPEFGADYCDINDKIQKKYKLETNKGVFIKKVEKFKAAYNGNQDMKGLKKNDILIKVNDREIQDVTDFNAIKDSLNIADQMKCTVIRDNNIIEVTIWVTWARIDKH